MAYKIQEQNSFAVDDEFVGSWQHILMVVIISIVGAAIMLLLLWSDFPGFDIL